MPSTTCVLALDQGTTSSRAILFDHHGRPLAVTQEEFPQHTRAVAGPDGGDLGVVEHDPEDIWRTQLSCARRVLGSAGIAATQVAAITERSQFNCVVWPFVSYEYTSASGSCFAVATSAC